MSSFVSAGVRSVAGKITRSGLETRRSRPPASMVVASEGMPIGMMPPMASLTAKERAALPDSAFAYIDSNGQRRLPIHDAPHVRNALARFSQVSFENDAARDR